MRRELSFLKEIKYSQAFRPETKYNAELDLTEDEIKEVTTGPGVYIIVSSKGIKYVYPKGTSSVIYIGKADNLRRRLREHLSNLTDLRDKEEYYLSNCRQTQPRYNYMRYHGAHVFLFYSRKKTQDAKNMEAEIIGKFYEKYRSIPVGNGARSFTKEKEK